MTNIFILSFIPIIPLGQKVVILPGADAYKILQNLSDGVRYAILPLRMLVKMVKLNGEWLGSGHID